MELFEAIAATAGVEAGEAATGAEVPPSLLAAARDPRRGGASVRLDVDGHELIAVIGGDSGDPHEWWGAIQRLASRLRSAS